MAVKYKFEVKPQSVVTPLGETFFMCLAEVNEVTGQFGGSLLFTEDQLDNEVTFKEWVTGDKVKKGFQQGIDDLIDEALEDYNSNNKRKAKRADKIIVHLDKEGEETDLFEFKIKNKDQPKIVDKFKQRIKDFDELLGNGSTIKCQVNLVPYFMQGKVGVTAYVDYVLIKEVVEYGGGGSNNPFDDDDFDDDAHGFDEDEEEEDEPEEEEPVKKPVRKPRAKPATTTEGEKDDF